MRGFPGVKRVEMAVCGSGRLGAYYEFTGLDAFKAYMDSPMYAEFKEDILKQDFMDMSKEPAEFVGFLQTHM